jgi:hypothetical protein
MKKQLIALGAVIAIYAILHVATASLAGSHGVLTPDGSVDTKLAVLVLATLAFRLTVLFVVPFAVIYRLVIVTLRRARSKSSP